MIHNQIRCGPNSQEIIEWKMVRSKLTIVEYQMLWILGCSRYPFHKELVAKGYFIQHHTPFQGPTPMTDPGLRIKALTSQPYFLQLPRTILAPRSPMRSSKPIYRLTSNLNPSLYPSGFQLRTIWHPNPRAFGNVGRGIIDSKRIEARDAATHPTVHRTALITKYSQSNTSIWHSWETSQSCSFLCLQ
jgi:hypothetical protein